ncbi:hypothetical protein BDV24DRAFT_129456 [Aspergillus arachidicola]|uniref:Secreted protein n=1 Tax=Aspergillus arachidicola TaxID=656916 RepID=A0A5N6YCQ8_9EURO|nr:hypothetical protein BDV24DRAFT_129456 [Aspergillus arachidicola]
MLSTRCLSLSVAVSALKLTVVPFQSLSLSGSYWSTECGGWLIPSPGILWTIPRSETVNINAIAQRQLGRALYT